MNIELLSLTGPGDTALVVNDHVIMTSDPVFGGAEDVEDVAERLAVATGHALVTAAVTVPVSAEDTWTWEEIVQRRAMGRG